MTYLRGTEYCYDDYENNYLFYLLAFGALVYFGININIKLKTN
jgi:hypothetical protein